MNIGIHLFAEVESVDSFFVSSKASGECRVFGGGDGPDVAVGLIHNSMFLNLIIIGEYVCNKF